MNRAYDHPEFRDNVEAYLVGGLTADERGAFEAHAAACAACAAALSEGAAEDAALRELFAAARPPADMEDRIVDRLQSARRPRPMLHPMVRRAATGVAAALMLGGFGHVATQALRDGGLPTPWAKVEPARDPGAMRGIKQGVTETGNESNRNRSPLAGVDTGGGRLRSPDEMARAFNHSVNGLADGPGVRLYKSTDGGHDDRRPARADGRWYWGEFAQTLPARPGSGSGASSGVASPAAVGPGTAAEEKRQKADGGTVAGALRGRDGAEADHKDHPGSGPAPGATPNEVRLGVGNGVADFVPGQPPPGAPRSGAGGSSVSTGSRTPHPSTPIDVSGSDARDRSDADNGRAPSAGIEPNATATNARSGAFRPDDYFVVPGSGAGSAASPDGDAILGYQKDGAGPSPAQQGQGRPPQEAIDRQSAAAQSADPSADPSAPPGSPSQPAPPVPTPEVNAAARKVIRNGEMSFEVDGFDSAYVQITKIAAEEGGFVATTDSEKLANGKVRGTVTVRCPPERLDTLVLKLRGLGDLKSSKLAAQDVTKQYTDLESQLRASRAMEQRLLDIIKTGKGEIKDLVEAEKQLGVYRERIEQVEGEIRYYNNLVSLSTLNVTLVERDIRTAAMLSETEQVDVGVEAGDVEQARAGTIKAIEEARGRIVESDLKKLEAGQFAARVVADVPPDAAGPLIDRMKQVGAVARLEVTRKQSAPDGTVAPAPAQGGAGVRIERRDTRFLISLYNLANVAPRQTTSLNLAADDVETAYREILEQVRSAGGRIVTSQLNRPRPDQTTGTITFEAPADGADVLLGAVRGAGEVMRLDVTQNPDARNVTEAKRGFAVQIYSLAAVSTRETTSLRLAARDVPAAFNELRETIRAAAGSRVLSSQLAEQDAANVTGTLEFEVRRDDWASVEAALREAGQVVTRSVSRSADAENTVDTKIRLQVVLADEASLPPRESVTTHLAVADVPGRYAALLEALAAAQARVLQSQLSEQEAHDQVTGTLVFDVRRESRAAVDRAIGEAGDVVSRRVTRSTDTLNTLDDKVRLSLTLTDADKLPPRETTTLGMEAADVEKAKEQVESLALGLGGRVVDSTLSREQSGRVIAKVVADVPLGKSVEMLRRTRDQGRVQFRRDAREESVPPGTLARARVDVTLANEELIVEGGRGIGATIREGLRTSVAGLLWSLQLIVVGLFLVAPWALIVYAAWRLVRRSKKRDAGPAAVPAT